MLPRDERQLAGSLLSEGKVPHVFHGIRTVIVSEVSTLPSPMITHSCFFICCVSIHDKAFLVS